MNKILMKIRQIRINQSILIILSLIEKTSKKINSISKLDRKKDRS